MKYWMLLFALLWVSYGTGMARKTEKVVNNGIPWFDDRGEIVNAHGACIVEENGRYYLFRMLSWLGNYLLLIMC